MHPANYFLLTLWSRGHSLLRDAIRMQMGGWPSMTTTPPRGDLWPRVLGCCAEHAIRACQPVSPPLMRVTAWPVEPTVGMRMLDTCYRSTKPVPTCPRARDQLWTQLESLYGRARPGEWPVRLLVREIRGDSALDIGSMHYFTIDAGEAVVPPGSWVVTAIRDGITEVTVESGPAIAALCAT